MVGLAGLFLTIIYIGAIFLRKKFSSALTSIIGVSNEHSHQLSAAAGRLARRMLLDMGLDALPLIGPILGHRRKTESGESGPSTMDEIKLWWKSRRGGRSGPVSDQSVESLPPVGGPDAEKPNTGGPSSSPGVPEINARFNGRAGRDDQPVFVYADRGSVAPEEGVPSEPVGDAFTGDRRVDSSSCPSSPVLKGNSGDGDSLSRFHGERLKQKSSEISVAQQGTVKGNITPSPQKTEKLSNFYGGGINERTDSTRRVRPKEAYPAERVGSEIRQDPSDNLNRLERETPKVPTPGAAQKSAAFREAIDASFSRLRGSQRAQASFIEESDGGMSKTTESDLPTVGRDPK